MTENRFSFIKILFVLVMFVYGILGLIDNQKFLPINSVDLMFHEFGHLLFSFMPVLLLFFGGTIMQLLIPNICLFYFILKEDFYSASVMLFWIAINLIDISIYIRDAQVMLLPLLIPGGTHDWNYILTELNLLSYDQIIGNLVYSIGILFFILSIVFGLYFSKNRNIGNYPLK